VDGYLLDTTALSTYLDPTHQFHAEKKEALDALPADASRYISAVSLAELMFGVNLAGAIGRGDLPALRRMIDQARAYAVLDLSHHTAAAYAALKVGLATKYLANVLRRNRPRYVENWVDKVTGKALGVDENDLWMCAQSKERDLILVTADARMKRIEDADSDVRLLII
jgi:predicted nucleic acid-binding protein